ncbi:MAG: ArsC/Spx/MgsR family protein, partial [Ketobacter sp.]
SYGHRNPQGAALDKSGQLWITEHGARGGDEVKDNMDEARAISLLVEHPAMIKRPVVVNGKNTLVGFKEQDFRSFFAL